MFNIPHFVTKVVYEFYPNLSDNIVIKGKDQFEMVFVRRHVYVLDKVATELLGYKTT